MAVSFIRTIVIFVAIIAGMRLMGKRQLGELEPSELVVAVLISNVASAPLQDTTVPLLAGLVPVVTLVSCEILVSGLILRSVKVRAFLCGKPALLIHNGVIDQKAMRENRFTPDELAVELRKQGVSDFTDVCAAVLETDGTVSVILNSETAALTPKQAGVRVPPEEYPVILINEGRTLSGNLGVLRKDTLWLRACLRREGLTDPRQVYLMTCTPSGKVRLVRKEPGVTP